MTIEKKKKFTDRLRASQQIIKRKRRMRTVDKILYEGYDKTDYTLAIQIKQY